MLNAADLARTAAMYSLRHLPWQCPLGAPEGPGPGPWEGVARACGGKRCLQHGVQACCALGAPHAKRAWGRAGATTERPRSGAERHHGAARRSPAERLHSTRTERLHAPPRGAAHGAGTEQLHEAACHSLPLPLDYAPVKLTLLLS